MKLVRTWHSYHQVRFQIQISTNRTMTGFLLEKFVILSWETVNKFLFGWFSSLSHSETHQIKIVDLFLKSSLFSFFMLLELLRKNFHKDISNKGITVRKFHVEFISMSVFIFDIFVFFYRSVARNRNFLILLKLLVVDFFHKISKTKFALHIKIFTFCLKMRKLI